MSVGGPWPDPPRPGELAALPIAAPAVLLDALGYRGGDQYVAVHVGPRGAVWLDDGGRRDEGDLLAWHRFTTHPVTEPLTRYDLGGAGRDASEWLLIDRDTNQLSVGRAEHVAEFLADQPHTRDRLTGLLTAKLVPTRAVDPDVRAARTPTGPGWQANADRAGHLLDALTRALNGSQVQQDAAGVVAGIGALSAFLHDQGTTAPGTAASVFTRPDRSDGAAWQPAAQPVGVWSTADPDPAAATDQQHEVDLS
ncbi:hypothetical protein ACQEVZ_55720 [Dactylosporangium sp. CA-152071]|uniref:hypothetical protein n=1 Tax=Dactylosporangium sp. CA-152071 TaxID=3239933 RepID=UPI003D8EDF18